ncbi:MAG: hypothetical protein ACI8RZ_006616 [Myxococcota bacterium]|jgi:hypothetical protein
MVAASTWPVPVLMHNHLLTDIDHADVQSTLWWFPSFAEALLEGRSPFQPTELAWPVGQDTRLLIWNYALALLLLPVTLLVDAPITRLNLSVLLISGANGLVAGLVGERIGGRVGGFAAMIVAAGSYFAFQEGGSGRMEQALWAPIVVYLWALLSLRQTPSSSRYRLIAAAALALCGAVYWFYAYFLVVLTVAAAVVWVLMRRLSRAGLVDLAVVGLGSLVLVSPFLIPVVLGQLSAPDFFAQMSSSAGSALYAQVGSSLMVPDGFIGPVLATSPHATTPAPLLMVPLCAAALLHPRLRFFGAIGLVASVLAAGPLLMHGPGDPIRVGESRLMLPHRLLDVLPGFSRLWWPYRWQAIGLAAASLSAAGILGSLRRGWLALPPLAAWTLLEGHAALHGGFPVQEAPMRQANIPEVFIAIGEQEGVHPILSFPTDSLSNGMMGFIPWHGQPISGGMAWSRPEVHSDASRHRDATVPLIAALQTLETTGRLPLLPQPLTESDAGGFHYLVLYQQGARRKRARYEAAITDRLGQPFYRARMVTVWALPGLESLPECPDCG